MMSWPRYSRAPFDTPTSLDEGMWIRLTRSFRRSKSLFEAVLRRNLRDTLETYVTTAYGFRRNDIRVKYLSPWEFVQHWDVMSLLVPGAGRCLKKKRFSLGKNITLFLMGGVHLGLKPQVDPRWGGRRVQI